MNIQSHFKEFHLKASINREVTIILKEEMQELTIDCDPNNVDMIMYLDIVPKRYVEFFLYPDTFTITPK